MEPEKTRPLIVASKKDQASLNIAQNLITKHGFTETHTNSKGTSYESNKIRLILVEKQGIFINPEDLPTDASSIIFASKHVSATGRPALTVHATGNLNNSAKFCGRPQEVSYVAPSMIKRALVALANDAKSANLKIETVMEATHHGPTSFQVPVCFVEIGSGPEQWADPVLGGIASDSIMAALQHDSTIATNAVGFGSTHYSEKHTKLNLEDNYSIGHLVPKHVFEEEVSDNALYDTFTKTVNGCKTAVIDWKGIKGEDRRRLLGRLDSWGIETVRV